LTELILNLEHLNPIEFFGVNNYKLDIIKKRYPLLKILSRGAKLKMTGQEKDLRSAQSKIDLVIQYLEKHGYIPDEYFKSVFEDEDNGDAPTEILSPDQGEILVYGQNGKVIRAKTNNQKKLVQAADKNDIIFAVGPAGTGKTYTAVALAVRALKNKSVKKIILTRPAVEAGESLGFLPGDLKEKIDPYLRPLYDALDDMLPYDKLSTYMTNRVIEIAPLAYMRGRTLDHSYIILDEAQNATDLQLKMFLTRIGPNAKAIITGDLSQVDLPKNQKSGFGKAIRILQNIPGIGHVQLDENDVVRHKLVKQIIKAYDKESIKEEQLEEERRAKRQAEYQKKNSDNL